METAVLLAVTLLAAQTETVTGKVQSADPAGATVVITAPAAKPSGHIRITGPGVNINEPGSDATPAHDVSLRARPVDIAALKAGSNVTVEAASYDGVLWLEPKEPLDGAAVMDGVVAGVDLGGGVLVLGDQQLHAHPRQLQGLVPGQPVRVSYAIIGADAWVAAIEPG